MTDKWKRREKKQHKAKYGHTVSGKSVFVTVAVQVKKANKLSEEK